jgi:hypothetical protein
MGSTVASVTMNKPAFFARTDTSTSTTAAAQKNAFVCAELLSMSCQMAHSM